MSGNVHPNPGYIFPCSVCASNMTWWVRSEQCCTCSKWVHSRCSSFSYLAVLILVHQSPLKLPSQLHLSCKSSLTPTLTTLKLTVHYKLTSPSLPSSLLSSTSGKCFKTSVLITSRFFWLSLFLYSTAQISILLPLIYRKLVTMTLLFTDIDFTILLQRNTLSFLCCCTLYFFGTECGQIPLLSAASDINLNPANLLKRKKR